MESMLGLGKKLETRPELLMEAGARLLRVRDRSGQTRALEANAVQRAFEQRRARQNIVLKARQIGMTTWIAGRFFLRTIARPGTMTLMVAHTREAAEANFRIVQRMWSELPRDLREGPLRLQRSNVGQMVFAKIDSEFRVASAADGNAGRGLSVQNLHCSEVARWPGDAAATLAGLRAALAPDGELVLESTPNGAYGAFYEAWSGAVDADAVGARDDAGLVRHFFPWWMEPAYIGPEVPREQMREDELLLMARHGLNEAQIGFRRGLESAYGELRAQEFAEDAESCFRATGACCFEVEAIERRMAEIGAAHQGAYQGAYLRRRGGALLQWLPPQSGFEYIVAVDSAGGGSEGDFATAQVVEMRTGLQCAELQERLRPAELARVVAELAREYGGALIAVERNNHGAAVLAHLETSERYRHVYRQRGEAGWLTTAASKPEMVARLGVLLAQTPERFMSRRLLAECRTFVADERGRAAAANGAHDDLVMAMAIAQAVRAERMQSRQGARAA
jgi:hypothetical protein